MIVSVNSLLTSVNERINLLHIFICDRIIGIDEVDIRSYKPCVLFTSPTSISFVILHKMYRCYARLVLRREVLFRSFCVNL